MAKSRRRRPATAQPAAPAQSVAIPPANASPDAGAEEPASGKRPPVRVTRQLLVRLAVVVFVVAGGVYLNTLGAEFAYDDVPIVEENEIIRELGNLPRIFRTNYWGLDEEHPDKSLYRPVTISSYALNYAIAGASPMLYHLTNLLLHALVSVVLFLLVRQLGGDHRLAFIAGLLFGVHPIHTEAVANVVGRAEILACLGILTSCLLWDLARREFQAKRESRGWLLLGALVICYFCGMASKETGVIAPAVIVLTECLLPQRRWLLRMEKPAFVGLAGMAVVLLIFMRLRAAAVISASMNIGFRDVDSGDRVATALRIGLEYIWLLICPLRLSADYWISDVPIADGFFNIGSLAGLAAVLAMLGFIAGGWRRAPIVCWGIGVFGGALLPISNLLFPIGVLKAERLLYTPSAGFVVVAAAALSGVCTSRRAARFGWSLVAVVTVLYGLRTWLRNEVWHDNITLATANLKTSPTSMTFNSILGHWHRANGRNAEAKEHYLRVLIDRPDEPSTLYNLANIAKDEKNYAEAISLYQRVLEIRPLDMKASVNLGVTLMLLGRNDEAAAAFERLRKLDPKRPEPYGNLLAIYSTSKNAAAALPVVEAMLQHFPLTRLQQEPGLAALYVEAAGIYDLAGRTADAAALRRQAAVLSPP